METTKTLRLKKFLDTNKIWMNQILKVWTVQKGTEWVSRSQYFLLLTCCIEKYTHNFNQRLLAQKCRQENGIIWKSLVSFRYFPIHLLAVLLIYSKLRHLFLTFRFNVFPKNNQGLRKFVISTIILQLQKLYILF